MAYPVDALQIRIEAAIGVDLTADPGTWAWTDITSSWYRPGGITDRLGRSAESGITESVGNFTLRNVGPDYVWSPLNAASAHWPYFDIGLPVRYSLNVGGGWVVQFLHYVSKITPSWDRSAALPLVAVETRGRLWAQTRRGEIARTALSRTYLASAPTLYYPLEDTVDAAQAASALPEGAPLNPSGEVVFGGTALLPAGGSASASIGTTGRLSVSTGIASNVDGGTTGWEAEVVIGWETFDWGTADALLVGFNMPTGHAYRQVGIGVFWDTSDFAFYLGHYDFDGVTTGTSWNTALGPVVAGRVYHYRIHYVQSGANVVRSRFRDGDDNGSGLFAGTNYLPTSAVFNPRYQAGQPDSVSHFGLWIPARSVAPATYLATTGFAGEMAHERIERLCDEAGIPFSSAATVSTAMGAQPLGTTDSLMREAEATDHGFLDDSQGGVIYYSLDEIVNQVPALTIDAAARQLGRPFSQDFDGSAAANDVTATDPRQGVGRFVDTEHQARTNTVLPATVAVNPESTSDLISHASWAALVRNQPEGRLPALQINMGQYETAEAHAAAWLAAGPRPGLRIDITDPPEGSYPRAPRLLLQGRTQTVKGPREGWTLSCAVVPAAPYDAAQYVDTPGNETEFDGHYDTDGCVLAEDLTTTETDALVRTTTGGPEWSGVADDLPYFVEWAGEEVEVTAVTPYATDGFSAVSASGWGTADSGQTWTIDGGVATDYTMDGSNALVTLAATSSRRSAYLAGVDEPYQDVMTSITGLAALTQPWRGSIILRRVDASNYYIVHLNFQTSGIIDLMITRRLAGVETNIGQIVTVTRTAHDPAQPMWLRAQCFGSTIRARAWRDDAEEPSYWLNTQTDTNFTTGSMGLAGIRLTGNTNAGLEVKFGSFVTLNPQVMTVNRSVNDIVKTIPAGTAVRLSNRSARVMLP